MKKIVIVTAHPDKESLCYANADAIERGAKKQGFETVRFESHDFAPMTDNPAKHGFPERFNAPRDAMIDAHAIVFCSPMWNFAAPGPLKSFLDGVVQSKYFFKFVPIPFNERAVKQFNLGTTLPTAGPKGLLTTKKVLVVCTADGPMWYYRIFPSKNHVYHLLRHIFNYCGVKKIDLQSLGMTRNRSEEEIKNWLQNLEEYSFEK
jgi:putative NADPH-quinone reductase